MSTPGVWGVADGGVGGGGVGGVGWVVVVTKHD